MKIRKLTVKPYDLVQLDQQLVTIKAGNTMKGIFEKKELRIIAKQIKGFRGFQPMFHAHSEIVYVISGSINMVIDDIPRTLSAGELSISFPYSIHSYETSEDAEAIIILFAPVAAGSFEKKLLSCKPASPYLTNAETLRPLLQKICCYAKTDDSDMEQTAGAYLEAVVGELTLALTLSNIQETDLNIIQKILSYCSEHYKEDISVKSVSAALYVSESAITKIFSTKLGYSFREYINILRISEAKSLLKHSNKRIIDIMYECGFQNQSSFNRVFYNDCGLTPKEYRDR